MEITPESWTRWLNHPVTKIFYRYIDDFKEGTARHIADAIAQGNPVPGEVVQEAVFRCQTYQDITTITCEQINEFYTQPTEEQNDDS